MSAPGFPPGTPARPRRHAGVTVSVAAAVVSVLTVLAVALWNYVLFPVRPVGVVAPTPTVKLRPTASATTSAETPTPSPTPTPARFPTDAKACPSSGPPVGGFSRSAVGNDVTSCPFAEAVREAYGDQPVRNGPVAVEAFSSVTGTKYSMTCDGDTLVRCSGGNNAVVYLI